MIEDKIVKKNNQKFNFKTHGIPCSLEFKAPDKKDKCIGITIFPEIQIKVDPTLSPKRIGEVLFHECTHAMFPQLSEKEVDKLGRTVINILYKAGYQIKKTKS